MAKKNVKVEEANVEEKVVADVEAKEVSAKEAGANFAKKVLGFGKKALPIALAFGAGVGTVIVAGMIGNKSEDTTEALDDASDTNDYVPDNFDEQ